MGDPHTTRRARLLAYLWLVASALWAPAARAQCLNGADGVITCGTPVVSQINDNVWVGPAPPIPNPNPGYRCPDGFDSGDPTKTGGAWANNMGSDLGGTYDATEFFGLCISYPSTPDPYAYPASCSPNTGADSVQEGPEHAWEFTCPAAGNVTVDLTGMDCELDLFVLPASCMESACEAGSDFAMVDEQVTFTCSAPGEVHYIVVEGWGFTLGGSIAEGTVPGTWCEADTPGVEGHYTLTVDPTSPACNAAESN